MVWPGMSPTAPDDTTACPADLDKQSKAVWKRTRTILKRDGRWRPEYSLLLERYVRAIEVGRLARQRIAARAVELAKAGQGEGMAYLTHGSQGQLVQHPDLKTAREAERDANEYGKELVLTPAARAKGGDDGQKPPAGKFGGAFGA